MGRPSLIKEGDVIELKNGFVKVIKFINHKNILVKPIENSVIAESTPYWTKNSNLNHKRSTTPFDRTLYGVGYRGVGKHQYKNKTPCHTQWSNMLKRCYCDASLLVDPRYEEVFVDKHWHNYQNFADWFFENRVDGFYLDKDLLTDTRKYSEGTCCFIPGEINTAIVMSYKQRETEDTSHLPVGVGFCKKTGKYTAKAGTRNNSEWGGRHSTVEHAFEKYLQIKNSQLRSLAEKHKNNITEEAYNALLNFTEERILPRYEQWK